MNSQSEIDDTLDCLGSVEPPPGLERRVCRRLELPRKRFSISAIQAVSACALAASVALFAVILNPALRSAVFHPAARTLGAADRPHVVAPAPGGFGTASAVHVPVEPVPVQPTPVNQGRGRSRSSRTVLPSGSLAPLPRGVTPRAPTDTTAPFQ